jgi:hypothetical protein
VGVKLPSSEIDESGDDVGPDGLLLSLNLHYFEQNGDAFVKALGAADDVLERDGEVNLSFGTKRIDTSDYRVRQQHFLEANDEYLSMLHDLGISAQILRDTGSVLALSLSLIAVSGQAGIVLTKELLARWGEYAVELSIDAL